MFSEAKARRVTQFIECLKHTKGEFHGEPFKLLPWQEKIIRDVFGTVRDDDPSMRQYNTAYIEIPKKNGKSELGAAIALNMLCNDDEWRAEVYSCASDRQQAAIVFDVAVDMVKQSPALSKRIKIIPSTKRMVYQPTGSIYQVLSSEVATKHGLNVSACIFDELHTQPTRALYDVMTQGSGDARKQPLWFLLTTAGTDRNSICWEVHQKALDMEWSGDRLRGGADARGYDSRWRKARALFLKQHPLCAFCQAEGKVVPATVVDHIIPHRGDQRLFWDQTNWEPLCKGCHDRKTGSGM